MASPIGSIITEVAVFDIHIERKAVAIMKPRIIFRTSVPIRLMIDRAMRLWRFHLSIAMAMMKPPI